MKDYSGYEDYFLSRRRWFFSFLCLTFLFDIFDTEIKGSNYLHSFGVEYPVRIVVNMALCLVGVSTSNRRIQLALLAVSVLYHVFLITTIYSTQ